MSGNDSRNRMPSNHQVVTDTLGTHIIADFYDAEHLTNAPFIEKTLRDAAIASGATVLESLFHNFESSGGVTGVVILSESHVSIHTWPEYAYASIDIFLCGDTKPEKAFEFLKKAFCPDRISRKDFFRGKDIKSASLN